MTKLDLVLSELNLQRNVPSALVSRVTVIHGLQIIKLNTVIPQILAFNKKFEGFKFTKQAWIHTVYCVGFVTTVLYPSELQTFSCEGKISSSGKLKEKEIRVSDNSYFKSAEIEGKQMVGLRNWNIICSWSFKWMQIGRCRLWRHQTCLTLRVLKVVRLKTWSTLF